MDDGVFPPEVPLGGPSDTAMDLDFVDELLLGGCWLETTDGSDFFNHSPSISGAYFDSSYSIPMLDPTNSKLVASRSQNSYHEEEQKSNLPEDSAVLDSPAGALVHMSSNIQSSFTFAGSAIQLGSLLHEGSELNRMFWIEPRANPGPAASVLQRLITALGFIKDSTRNRDVLIQIWVPVNRGGARILTTIDQPFTLDTTNSKLAHYRDISVNYQFAAEEDSRVSLGLPGRVYVSKVPEWTPDVRFYKVEEFPRVNHAQKCDVRGTVAVPVFEQGSRECLGVIELVMTMQKANYRPELESVCKALQAVDLQSSGFPDTPRVKELHSSYNSSYVAALPEILEVIKSACETHGLPLAQTWVPCIQQGKRGCRHSDENLALCASTVDSACFVNDPQIQGFHETCSEHHLLKGQGIAGRAFLTNQPCFSADITSFCKTEYPLSHHARMFGLCAAVAIRLRSIYTGTSDFVLEFFLPTGCRDPEEQKKMLSSLSTIIRQVCRSLRVVEDKELQEETTIAVSNRIVMLSDDSSIREKTLKVENAISSTSSQEESAGAGMQWYGSFIHQLQEDKSRGVVNGIVTELKQEEPSPEAHCVADISHPTDGEGGSSALVLSGEKKRAKSDRIITLEVLRQHFAGSLKDAAKNLGVCPTTLKRICRQHGIKRWPSRKIKKVGHSLQKLQVVIDSVQGASGAFQIGSFYSNFPQLASANVSGSASFSAVKSNDLPKASTGEPEGSSLSPTTVVSKSPSSSCSQSSSSSQCCSSGSPQRQVTCNTSGSEDLLTGENSSESALKRARSEAELHASTKEVNKLISRSQSHKSLNGNQNVESHPPLPKYGGQVLQDDDAWRVKVTYGEEKIRFRLGKNWGYKELVQEIVRRFNVGDISGFHLKYLDDDSEWVLLTCDADLEECIDVCRSSQPQTIKLALQVSHSNSRSSVGSNRV